MYNKLWPLLCVCAFSISLSTSSAEITDAEWEDLKEQAINRKRQVIYNTDGCDALYFPRELEATRENFINRRLVHALGSKIDTISYCPISSGFGYLTSRTKAGDQLLAHPPQRGYGKNKRNVTGEFLKLGTDPLQIAKEFAHENNFEFWVSLRVNDTHDMTHTKDNPHFLFPPFKSKHPEYLMGSYYNRPPHAQWSAVDFTHKAVRERFLAIVEELATNYDIDGIELDFCRHLQYFKSVAWGGRASQEELEMMTDCLRQIRALTERIGRQRKRPILVAARLPDCIEYSKAVGLDVETWMREKLIDIYIGSFYFRLNPWEESVRVSRKYGVKFYPSMDETRIRKFSEGFGRHTLEADRARQAAALQAGVDGIYFFNREGARHLKTTMRGNMDDIRRDNKRYFITYRHYSPQMYLRDGIKYSNLPTLSHYTPALISPGKPRKFVLEIGDDFNHPKVKKLAPVFTAYVDTDAYNGKRLVLRVNGRELQRIKTNRTITSFAAPLEFFRPGLNEVELDSIPAEKSERREIIIMSGKELLQGRAQPPWRRLFRVHDFPSSEKIVNGAYWISDTGTEGEKANLLYPISEVPGENLRIKFQAKVERSTDPLAVVCRMADGKYVEIITLQPDRIGLYYAGKSVKFNTTDRFHTYEASMKNGRFILKVNNKVLFDTELKMRVDNPAGRLKNNIYTIPNMHRQSLSFGSLSGKGTGSALWKNVRMLSDSGGVFVNDLKFELVFPSLLKKYSEVSPERRFNFNVADGKIPESVSHNYREATLFVIEGDNGKKALRLDHSAGYQSINVIDHHAFTHGEVEGLIIDWKMKYLSGVEGEGSFQVVVKPQNAKKQTLMCPIVIFADKARAPWGDMEFPACIKDRWVTFRLVLDANKGSALLSMNGKYLGHGSFRIRDGIEPGIWFGDGSGAIAGKVDLEYLKIKIAALSQ